MRRRRGVRRSKPSGEGASMNLTDGEKLILLMLCDIQKSLNVKGSLDIDALRSSLLDDLKDYALGSNETQRATPDRESVTREVSEILDMWSAIERGYKRLTVDEKREVAAGCGSPASTSIPKANTARWRIS
jgi:hypothetical protein